MSDTNQAQGGLTSAPIITPHLLAQAEAQERAARNLARSRHKKAAKEAALQAKAKKGGLEVATIPNKKNALTTCRGVLPEGEVVTAHDFCFTEAELEHGKARMADLYEKGRLSKRKATDGN